MALTRASAGLRRFAHIAQHRRLLLVEAAAWLLLARLSLILISFQRLARHFGTLMPPADPRALRAKSAGSQIGARLAEDIGWAVTRAARYVPFKAVCLPQAMAAQAMLKRRGVGSLLHFGARRGTRNALEAHAWLEAAGVKVTGYPAAETFAELGCFV